VFEDVELGHSRHTIGGQRQESLAREKTVGGVRFIFDELGAGRALPVKPNDRNVSGTVRFGFVFCAVEGRRSARKGKQGGATKNTGDRDF
jgi:hypothetical protein